MALKRKEGKQHGDGLKEACASVTTVGFLPVTAVVMLALCLAGSLGCTSPAKEGRGYTSPDTVKTVVKQAKDDLSSNQVQHARHLIEELASEADINVTQIPLATYPAAIRAVAALIDAGKFDEAKDALYAALHTIVIDTCVIPLPKVRAEAMLAEANRLVDKKQDIPEFAPSLMQGDTNSSLPRFWVTD